LYPLGLVQNPKTFSTSLSPVVGVGIYIRYFDIDEGLLPPGRKLAVAALPFFFGHLFTQCLLTSLLSPLYSFSSMDWWFFLLRWRKNLIF
jgi:hypothetical protein